MIEIQSLSKSFGRNEVLKQLNLRVDKGEALAVLGPNGSGKTTLIKCVLGLVIPDEGELNIHGHDISDGPSVRKSIGYMPQISHFPDNMTAYEILDLVNLIRGLNPDPSELIEYFDLQPHMHKSIRQLSGGTVQKISALVAFLYDTPVIILDEPTAGLDPIARLKLKALMKKTVGEGKTLLFTSHILADVQELSNRIVFLLDGHIHFDGSASDMLKDTGEENLEKAIASYLKESQA